MARAFGIEVKSVSNIETSAFEACYSTAVQFPANAHPVWWQVMSRGLGGPATHVGHRRGVPGFARPSSGCYKHLGGE